MFSIEFACFTAIIGRLSLTFSFQLNFTAKLTEYKFEELNDLKNAYIVFMNNAKVLMNFINNHRMIKGFDIDTSRLFDSHSRTFEYFEESIAMKKIDPLKKEVVPVSINLDEQTFLESLTKQQNQAMLRNSNDEEKKFDKNSPRESIIYFAFRCNIF